MLFVRKLKWPLKPTSSRVSCHATCSIVRLAKSDHQGCGYKHGKTINCGQVQQVVAIDSLYPRTFSAGFLSAGETAEIEIDKQPGPNPWSDLEFPDAEVEFQFAVVSDNTGGAYPGVFDMAMTKLNLMQPEFVMSVGDLIEGYSNDREALAAEWEEIDASIDKLTSPSSMLLAITILATRPRWVSGGSDWGATITISSTRKSCFCA